MLKKMFLFVFLLFVSGYVYSDSDDFSCVKFGDQKTKKWSYRDEDAAGKDATMQEAKKEVKALFKNELKDFDSKLDKVKIVDALTHLIEYNSEETGDGDFYTICVRLDNVHLKNPQYKFIFQPKKIGEVCSFSQQVREKLSDEIRRDFVSALTGKNIPKFILSMLNEASNIKLLSKNELSQYIYEQEIQSKLKSIEGTKCISLFVYPVELYTLSSSEKFGRSELRATKVHTKDDDGKEGELYILVVEKDYHWKIGKLDVIIKTDTDTNTSKPVDFVRWLGHPEFQKKVNELKEIVNIGMASCGGTLTDENIRGKVRTRKLTEWISRAFRQNKNLKVYGLNLGKHRYSGAECKQLSAEIRDSQRRILLIGITKNSDPELDIQSALQNAMTKMAVEQPENLPINPSDYHLFDLIEN